MRKIVNSTFVSLDGIVNHMDRWHFDFVDEDTDTLALEQLRASDAMLMGRHTYDSYAAVWPERSDEYSDLINAVPKYVVSTTMTTAAWQNTTVLGGDLVEDVTHLKAQDGKNILMHGYGPVAKTLVSHGLLDELCLWIHPVLAGVGTTDDMIWAEHVHARFTVQDVQAFDSGVVTVTYRSTS
jgi:dihydrofolate reductase